MPPGISSASRAANRSRRRRRPCCRSARTRARRCARSTRCFAAALKPDEVLAAAGDRPEVAVLRAPLPRPVFRSARRQGSRARTHQGRRRRSLRDGRLHASRRPAASHSSSAPDRSSRSQTAVNVRCAQPPRRALDLGSPRRKSAASGERCIVAGCSAQSPVLAFRALRSRGAGASDFPTGCCRADRAAVTSARAEDWPEFRGPTGQGHSSERGVPFEWSESRNVPVEDARAGLGWSSPVVAGGRVWLTTAVKDRGGSLRALAFDVETGRELVNTEVFRARTRRPVECQEHPRLADADRRRRSRLRPLRRRRHGGAHDRRARSSGRSACPTTRSTATADRRCCTATC